MVERRGALGYAARVVPGEFAALAVGAGAQRDEAVQVLPARDPLLELRVLARGNFPVAIDVEEAPEERQRVIALAIGVGAREHALVRLGLGTIERSVAVRVVLGEHALPRPQRHRVGVRLQVVGGREDQAAAMDRRRDRLVGESGIGPALLAAREVVGRELVHAQDE